MNINYISFISLLADTIFETRWWHIKGSWGSMDIEREFRHFPCYLCLLDLLKGVKHVQMYDLIDVTYVSS
jgi:hypothetical protein